jgi:hypothetical protein
MGHDLWTDFYGTFYQILSDFCTFVMANMLY